jgi:hypothetical protein
MYAKTTPIVLSVNEWKTDQVRYMQPKVNERGGKAINIISTQSNRSLHLSTPLMMTWGISDFVDEKTGESDGKFSMSLNFPNQDYGTPATTQFLDKLKEFESQILDDAVKNSEIWFGEEMSREVAKHTFFPFLKYSKDKLTKRIDTTKPPSIRAKVPNYNGKWGIEVYDTKQELLFPCDNENITPMDFVPKKSSVACVLQCGGLWFGGKGWGITWKVNQCVVKPSEVVSVFGKCHIQLSPDEIQSMEVPSSSSQTDEDQQPPTIIKPEPINTIVADSDDDDEEDDVMEELVADSDDDDVIEEPEPVAVVVVEAPKKKIIKKKIAAPEPIVVDKPPVQQVDVPKKKIVKKKIVT